jgi:hypothetical protein
MGKRRNTLRFNKNHTESFPENICKTLNAFFFKYVYGCSPERKTEILPAFLQHKKSFEDEKFAQSFSWRDN